MSNSKLTTEQKVSRKVMLRDLRNLGGTIDSANPFTVVKLPEFRGSRMALFSVSVMSPTENKFRRKVGEYWALTRVFEGLAITLPNTLDCSEFLAFLDEHDTNMNMY